MTLGIFKVAILQLYNPLVEVLISLNKKKVAGYLNIDLDEAIELWFSMQILYNYLRKRCVIIIFLLNRMK